MCFREFPHLNDGDLLYFFYMKIRPYVTIYTSAGSHNKTKEDTRMSRPDTQIIEKRKFPRLMINAYMTYALSGDSSNYKAFCKNLSHSGVLFISEHLLSPGNSVSFTLGTESSGFFPLKAKIDIIRTEPSENSHMIAGKIVEYQ